MKPKDIYKTICYTFLIQSIAGFQTQGPSSVLARRRSSLGIHFVRTAPVFRPVLSATARLATDDGSSSSPAASSCNKWLVSPWRLERRTKFLQSCDSKLRKLRDVLSKWTRILKRTVAILAISFMMTHAAMAVTGGRVGGSFGKSSSSSSSSRYSSPGRVYSRPRYNYRSYGAPSVYYSGPPTTSYFFSTPRFVWGSPSVARVYADSAIQTRVSPTDVLLLTGTTALLAYGFYNNNKAHRDDTSPLGPGASVASIVLSLNVPDQNESNSVLSRLRSISEAAQTGSRQGVQDLVTEVCLELSRREQSMVSAVTDSRSYSSVSQAESAFRVQSLRNRSRLDRESGTYRYVNDKMDYDF